MVVKLKKIIGELYEQDEGKEDFESGGKFSSEVDVKKCSTLSDWLKNINGNLKNKDKSTNVRDSGLYKDKLDTSDEKERVANLSKDDKVMLNIRKRSKIFTYLISMDITKLTQKEASMYLDSLDNLLIAQKYTPMSECKVLRMSGITKDQLNYVIENEQEIKKALEYQLKHGDETQKTSKLFTEKKVEEDFQEMEDELYYLFKQGISGEALFEMCRIFYIDSVWKAHLPEFKKRKASYRASLYRDRELLRSKEKEEENNRKEPQEDLYVGVGLGAKEGSVIKGSNQNKQNNQTKPGSRKAVMESRRRERTRGLDLETRARNFFENMSMDGI